MKNKISTERVERIMRSLDSMHKAAAPDFFYTRLKGKMQAGEDNKTFFILRPAFITAVLSLFLVINVFSLLEINKASKQQSAAVPQSAAGIESFATAYNMNTGSVYE
ncbi:MAG: hypothetical protein ABIO79_09840 [Ferruginibacter sp.]